jgi:hypothetical protein
MEDIKNFENFILKKGNNIIVESIKDDNDINIGDTVYLVDEKGLSDAQLMYLETQPIFTVQNVITKGDELYINIGYRVALPLKNFNKITSVEEYREKFPEFDIPIDPLTGEIKNIDFKNLPKIKEFTLFISKDLIDILNMMESVVARTLMNNNYKILSQQTFLDVNPNVNNETPTITSLSSSKIAYLAAKEGINLNDINLLKDKKNIFWTTTSRTEIRISVICQELFGDFFTPSIIEDFVNEFKHIINRGNIYDNFTVIKGEKIKEIYMNRNGNIHDMTGKIKDSCMIGKDSSILDLYCVNPDKVGLLVLKDPNNPKRILGRALLWENLLKPKGRTFMDRIYCIKEELNLIFIEYAIKNDWLYKPKKEQNFYTVDEYMDGYNRVREAGISTKITSGDYPKYPYMDTLKFYSIDTGRLGSLPGNNIGSKVVVLQNPNGGISGTYEFGRSYKDYVRRP